MFKSVYSDDAMSCSQAFELFLKVKAGRYFMKADERSCNPCLTSEFY